MGGPPATDARDRGLFLRNQEGKCAPGDRYCFGGLGRAGAPGRPEAVGRCGRAADGVGRFLGGVTRLLVIGSG